MKQLLKVLILGLSIVAITAATRILKPVAGKLNQSFRHESAPSVTSDGLNMFYIRLNPNKKGAVAREDWDLYMSTLKNGKWVGGRPIRGLNSDKYEGYPSVTANGKTLYYSSNAYSTDGDKDIYVSYYKKGKWSKPKKLGEAINIEGLDEIGASISPNGRILVFTARDRDDCIGETDIYISYRSKNGKWLPAKNLGRYINSKGAETAPYIAADGKTLYFSSNKRGGFGKQDIYKSVLTRGTWSRPRNLGSAINTRGHDIGISIPASGETFFTSASIKGNGYDIYTGKLPLSARPLKVVLLKANIYDKKNKKKIKATVLLEDLDSGKNLDRINYLPSEGETVINLTEGTAYAITVQAHGYFVFTDNFNLKRTGKYRQENRSYYLTPIKKGEIAEVKNIFFASGSARLSSISRKALVRVAKLLRSNQKLKLEIQGHTDNIGNKEYNQKLSQNRAKMVYQFLTKLGINKSQLSFVGYGSSKPKVENTSRINKAKNRRIEFLVKNF